MYHFNDGQSFRFKNSWQHKYIKSISETGGIKFFYIEDKAVICRDDRKERAHYNAMAKSVFLETGTLTTLMDLISQYVRKRQFTVNKFRLTSRRRIFIQKSGITRWYS